MGLVRQMNKYNDFFSDVYVKKCLLHSLFFGKNTQNYFIPSLLNIISLKTLIPFYIRFMMLSCWLVFHKIIWKRHKYNYMFLIFYREKTEKQTGYSRWYVQTNYINISHWFNFLDYLIFQLHLLGFFVNSYMTRLDMTGHKL